ncbi:Adenosine deaminase [Apiospora marii]|uniref:Adenosine deaminase n=1 Tax=Apiospora marii TaxID=335849 RepID=UPI003130793C
MASEPEADMDFQSMPKIEIHAHLSGSISRQCLHEIWSKKKAAGSTDLEDPLVVMPVDKHDYDLNTFFPLFSSYIYHLVDDVDSLTYTTKSVVADFAADGVVYLELRTTPRAMATAGLDKAGYVEAVLDAMAAAQAEHPSIRAKLILSMDRRNTPEEAREVVLLARQFRARGVVGVDLCGDPAKGDVALFTPAVREAKAAAGGGLGVTIHFAEAECSASEAELQTIMDWDPDRLGHVIHVPEHIKRRITAARPSGGGGGSSSRGLELCLSCNVHAKMIVGSFEAHHFGEWWRVEGVTVVPCTDDVGVFGSPVSNEWRLIQRHFKLTRAEILELVRKGIDVIFGGEEEKQRLRRLMW